MNNTAMGCTIDNKSTHTLQFDKSDLIKNWAGQPDTIFSGSTSDPIVIWSDVPGEGCECYFYYYLNTGPEYIKLHLCCSADGDKAAFLDLGGGAEDELVSTVAKNPDGAATSITFTLTDK